jgi:hypothetical protein
MNERQIKIGRVYTAKITNREVPLRIDEKHTDGGWITTSLASGKRVRIKTAARFGREVTRAEIKSGKAPGMDKSHERRTKKTTSRTKTTATPVRKATTNGKSTRTRAISGLDAAHKVLQESDTPLSAREVIDQAVKKGYWKSQAATPQATIHAAMSREIKNKGKDSRFKKVGRGRFAANS